MANNGPIRLFNNEFGEEVMEEDGSFSLSLPDDGDYYNANDEAFITHTKEERIEYLRERHKVFLRTVGPHRFTEKEKDTQSRMATLAWESDKGQERKAKMHKQSDEARSKNRSKAIGRKRKYLPDGSWIWEKQ